MNLLRRPWTSTFKRMLQFRIRIRQSLYLGCMKFSSFAAMTAATPIHKAQTIMPSWPRLMTVQYPNINIGDSTGYDSTTCLNDHLKTINTLLSFPIVCDTLKCKMFLLTLQEGAMNLFKNFDPSNHRQNFPNGSGPMSWTQGSNQNSWITLRGSTRCLFRWRAAEIKWKLTY